MGRWPWSAGLICAIALAGAPTGCDVDSDPDPPRAGPATRSVTVTRGEETYPVTAEVTGWRIGPHPQVPDRGDAVHFSYRFTGDEPGRIDLQVCAIDDHRVVLLCTSVSNTGQDNDDWIGPSEGMGLSRTANVVLLPDQMFPGLNAGDPKDHDGYVPPRLLGPGDQL